MDVVYILCALAVGERGMQDHDGAAVYDEANLSPERAIESLGEIRQHLLEELSGERGVVDSLEGRDRHGHGNRESDRERPRSLGEMRSLGKVRSLGEVIQRHVGSEGLGETVWRGGWGRVVLLGP
jgi:hypothetical protein